MYLLLILLPLLPTVAAWWSWTSRDHRTVVGVRRVLFLGGLSAASASLLLYLAFDVFLYFSGGLEGKIQLMVPWIRRGLLLALLAVVLSLLGKGKSRLLGLASGLLLFALWPLPLVYY